ncbi:MAG: class I SAM-dependent methyltransferase [Alphaproteobacteria bacterium]
MLLVVYFAKRVLTVNFLSDQAKINTKMIDGILRTNVVDNETVRVANFYRVAPFPNYEGFETKAHLNKVLASNSFLKDLKETIGLGKKFIEVGSGTSQLSLAMATGTNNLVVALDPTLESLELGKRFACSQEIDNVVFLQADIFEDPIQSDYFDCVWCSGVLHHTQDPKQGFEIITRWAKKDGLIILGLYNRIGRLRTYFRKILYLMCGRSFFGQKVVRFFDPRLRGKGWQIRERAWFRDQYQHPVETAHSIDEVLNWFRENEIEFLGAIPSLNLDGRLEKISEMDGKTANFIDRIIAQILLIFTKSGSDGGVFIVVGRKK